MFFNRKKNNSVSFSSEKLDTLSRILRDFPPESDHFPDALGLWARLLEARGISLFLHEEKTRTFLFRQGFGARPSRLTISADSSFLKYLEVHVKPVSRIDFTSGAHELREPALLFFQQTSSNHIEPIWDGRDWVALLTLDFASEKTSRSALIVSLMQILRREVLNWLHFRKLSEQGFKMSELGHVKDQLLTNVTHELQTPLNGIIGMAEGLLDGGEGELPESLCERLRIILKSGRELHNTVNNILKLTRIEATKEGMRFERTNLSNLIDEISSLFAKAMSDKSINFQSPTGHVPEVLVEPDHIRTLLMNLIGNAVKFTEKNGHIAVDVVKNGQMLHVSVSDDGIGIAPEKLELIFEEFYQEDGSHTRVYGGTGLGLAIARKVVALHGGRIWADSLKGKGARFTFTLPLFPG